MQSQPQMFLLVKEVRWGEEGERIAQVLAGAVGARPSLKAAIEAPITFSCWKLQPQPRIVKETSLMRWYEFEKSSQKTHLCSAEPRQTGVIWTSNPDRVMIYSSICIHSPLTQNPNDTCFKYSNTYSDFKQALSTTQTDSLTEHVKQQHTYLYY